MPVQTRWGLGSFTVRTWNKFGARLTLCEQTGAACPPTGHVTAGGPVPHAAGASLQSFCVQDGGLGIGVLLAHLEGW